MILIGLSLSSSTEGLKDNKLNFLSVINFELKFSSKMIFLMKSNDAK